MTRTGTWIEGGSLTEQTNLASPAVAERKTDKFAPPLRHLVEDSENTYRDAPGSWSSGQVDLPTRKEHSNGYQHW